MQQLEFVDDVPHRDDCECGDCACTQNPYQHADPCDCDDCRAKVMHNYDSEPPVGAVARCSGCGSIYVHRPDGWLATDGPFLDSWGNLSRSFCGPVKVIYTPEGDK